MQNLRFVILGGGPAGLSFARRLLDLGEDSFVVLEQERTAGGLCRSQTVDGAPLDIGGGHFLDTRRPAVLAFLLRFLPESEWARFTRISHIRLGDGVVVDHPIEANLWQLPPQRQDAVLRSLASAEARGGGAVPAAFTDWIRWQLGDAIADAYMLPYNRKLWGEALDELGTYWLDKLPRVTYAETLQSCAERRAAGTVPAHQTFLYPRRGGYGELWRRLASSLGDRLRERCRVQTIDLATRTVNGAFRGDVIVNTIPWPLWPRLAGVGGDVAACMAELKHASVVVEYHEEDVQSDAHWIYVPDEAVAHHRMLLRPNFQPGVGRGHWVETNARRYVASGRWHHVNEYAYPVNTRGKPAAVRAVLDWAAAHGVHGLGRWGEWEHFNSDVVVERALALADRLAGAGEAARCG